MTSQTPLLEARNVTKAATTGAETLTILHQISCAIYPQQTVAITGASGSGKSTLLSLFAGLDRPTNGEIWLDGICLSSVDEETRTLLRRQYLGFIFQSFQLLPGLTALENVRLPLDLLGTPNAKEQACDWLARVGLSSRLQHLPHQLSGGEQQRVAVARAFVAQPKVLMADEPTGNLDYQNAQEIMRLMFQLHQETGTTLLLVTHDVPLAHQCGRQLELVAGKLVSDSLASPTKRNPHEPS